MTQATHSGAETTGAVGQEVYTFPLSSTQQMLWLAAQMGDGGAVYHVPSGYRLRGPLSAAVLARALDRIVARHEALRTTFAVIDGEPAQVVHADAGPRLAEVSLEGLAEGDREAALAARLDVEARRPFDLVRGPLFRATLFRLGAESHVLLVTAHHLVWDGWSEGVFIGELRALYDAFLRGEESPLAELPVQYGDYATWEREALDAGEQERLVGWWRRRLAGAPEALELPTDRPRPDEPTFRGATCAFTVPADTTAQLAALAREQGGSVYPVALALFGLLLHRLSGQSDVLVGSPVANRGQVELEGLIGAFVNTVVLRLDCSGDPTFRELVARARETVFGAQEHQELPFERLVSELAPRRAFNRNPLFQAMLSFTDATGARAGAERGLAVEPFAVSTGTSKFDLLLNVQHGAGGLECVLEYATDLFDAATAQRMAACFRALAEGAAACAGPVSRLALVDGAGRERLEGWSAARAAFPVAGTLHARFEARAARTPNATAAVFGDRSLTYAELNARANRLARRLRALGVGPETRVGLAAERSLELVAGVLAIVKAGGAYVPLDPAYPAERLAYMAGDAGIRVLLAQPHLADRIPAADAPVLWLDDAADEDGADLPPLAGSDGTAYVIYTSGSTGRPKGVEVTHANVLRLFAATDQWFGFGATDVWTLFHSYAFDFSVWELWGALLYGGTLVVVPWEVSRDPAAFLALLADRGVTVLNQTPSAFRGLVTADDEAARRGAARELALRWVVFGGEALEPASLRTWAERRGDASPRLINMYGITETTVHVTYRPITADDVRTGGASPIGIGIPDLSVRLLDAAGNPVPPGVAGELYVGGGGVARGYLGRPALTAQRFVPDPFGTVPGARLYRSGDRARWRESGELEYLGRLDEQVKVRGFRIEVGEIEAALRAHPAVRDCALVVREDAPGEKRLAAYLAGAGGGPATAEIRAFVAARLPDYMVPATFTLLDALPLTANGKLDRRALPAPEATRPEDGAYEAPRTAAEAVLAAVWSQVLGVPSVGIHDDFYALGGDSIRILRVVALCRDRGVRVSIRDVARHPTVAALAAAVAGGEEAEAEQMRFEPFSLITEEDRAKLPEGVVDAYPLARTQLGMLFHQEHSDSPMYHTLDSWRFRMPLDEAAFTRAVLHVTARHPNLRTGFDLESYSEPLQLVWGQAAFPVGYHDLRHLPHAEQDGVLKEFFAAEQARAFDLACPPQLRFHLHRRTDELVQFTLVENHALFDGWSLHTILAEVLTCYQALLRGEGVPALPELTTTYRDFIGLERKTLESAEARDFWVQRLEGYQPAPLPAAPSAERTGQRVGRVEQLLRRSLVRELSAVARRQAVPLKTVLLAVHLKVLGILTGRTDVVSGLSTNGRPETEDGDRICGLFLNTLPHRADLSPASWGELIRRVREAELAAMPYRRYPLSAIQSGTGAAGPLFDASFVYLNFHVIAEHVRSGELAAVGMDAMVEETNFALMTSFQHLLGNGERIVLNLECDRAVFSDHRIAELGTLYMRALRAVAADASAPHHAFDALPPAERGRVLAWGAGEDGAPLAEPVHALFARHAAADPSRPFLVSSAGTLSRGEVEARAGALAARLRALGVRPGGRVAVVMDRVPQAVIALLAAWKAGAAYLPVDPAYPRERLAWVLRDAGVAAAVTLDRWLPALEGAPVPIVALDTVDLAFEVRDSTAPHADPAAAAYVIYTSGTTGRPKGVVVEHRQVMHYTGAVRSRLQLPDDASWLLVSTFAADLGNTALFPALAGGGALHVADEREAADPAALAAFAEAHPADAMKVVPSHLRALLAHERPEALLPRARLVLGGDAADWALVARVRALAPECRVFNHYGPTETTVGVVAGELDPADAAHVVAPPLGRPLGHARAYVLDPFGRLAPAGTPGELYFGGPCVSRGYLERPSLTAGRFVADPFSAEADARMYRTGDRARWLPDGRLEFLGRTDQQVKVRGYRVEPREVEAVLRLHDAVEQAAVVARAGDGEVRLAAYVVAAPGARPAEPELRAFLEARLSPAMVPSTFTRLDALPLTPNGKLDHRRLPAPGAPRAAEAEHDLPRSEAEAQVVELWKSVLKLDHVGVHDGFVELGGDSIKAILLAARIRKAFGVPLSVETLLTAQTPAGLAGSIEMARQQAGSGALEPIVPLAREGEPLPLSFAQQRLWYTSMLDPESPAHNLPFTFRLRGALDADAWRRALEEIVRRHQVLRSRYPVGEGGDPAQVIDPASVFAVRETDLRGRADAETLLREHARRDAWTPFDLERGPLARASLLRVGDEEYGAVIAFHHIVFDGWSAGVLMHELTTLYAAFHAGEPSPLAELPVQYADFAAWQRRRLGGEALEGQLAWWREQLAGVPALALPTDWPRPERRAQRGANETAVLSADAGEALRAVSRREGVTLFMTLLAGYAALLARESGQTELAVGCPVVVNRDRPELHGVMGLFLNSLAIRVDLSGPVTFRELLVRVRHSALGAFTRQEVPFERIVEALRLPRDAARTPVFQVWFNHSAIPGEPLAFDGVRVGALDAGDPTIKFDLRLATEEAADGRLVVYLGYDADLFEAATARRLLARLETLLAAAAAHPAQPLAGLFARLDDEDRREQARRAGSREASLRTRLQGARRQAVEIPG